MGMDHTVKIAHPQKLRWYQFSLRTLFIFMTLVAGITWFGMKLGDARRQKEAIEAIRRLGGEVHFEYEYDSEVRMYINDEKIPGPAWARAVVGDDFFRTVSHVSFYNGHTASLDLKYLEDLPQLEYLDIRDLDVTDSGVEHLRNLSQLKTLWLDNSQVTDAGLRYLERLTLLKSLGLSDTHVTEAGVAALQRAIPDCVISAEDTMRFRCGCGPDCLLAP